MTRKSFLIALAVIVVAFIGLFVLNKVEDNRKTWDTEYPLINTNVSWGQTWFAGSWSDAV